MCIRSFALTLSSYLTRLEVVVVDAMLYIYIYIYIYININIYIYIYIYIYIHIQTSIYLSIDLSNIHTVMYTCSFALARYLYLTGLEVFVKNVVSYIEIYMDICVHKSIYLSIYIYMHTKRYIIARSRSLSIGLRLKM